MAQAFNIGNLIATIGANLAPLNLALKQANANMKASALKMSKSMDVVSAKMMKVSASMKTVGMGFTKALTLPFAVIAGASLKVGADFEKAMSQVQATMGVTKADMVELEAIAKKMGSTTKFSATESAEALNFLALAGYDSTQQISALPKVLTLATAGNMDLATASDMLTDSMSALGLASSNSEVLASNMNIMVDQMAKTSSKANTSVSQLGEAILTIGGTAKMLKGGTTELNTSLGLLADNGIKGSEAGTMLRNMTLAMTPTTEKAAEAFEQLGLQTYDTEGNMKSFQDIFGDLNTSMSDMTSEDRLNIMSQIFNKRDLKAVSALLGTTTERWTGLSDAVANSTGAGAKMADTQLKNWSGQLTILKSSLEGVALKISEVLLPIVKRLTDYFQGLTDKMNAMSPEALESALKIAAIAAAIGPAIFIISKLVAGVGMVTKAFGFLNKMIAKNPWVALGIAIVAIIAYVVHLWKKFAKFRAVVKFTAQKIAEYFKKAWIGIKMGAEIFFEILKAYFGMIPKMAKLAGKAIAAIFDKDKKVGDVLKEEWEKIANGIVETAVGIKEKYKAQMDAIESPDYKTILAAEQAAQAAKEAGKKIKQGLATGMGETTTQAPQMATMGALPASEMGGLEVDKLKTNSNKLVAVANDLKSKLGEAMSYEDWTIAHSFDKVAEAVDKVKRHAGALGEAFDPLMAKHDALKTQIDSMVASNLPEEADALRVLSAEYQRLGMEIDKTNQKGVDMGSMLAGLANDSLVAFGEGIGNMLSGTASAGDLFTNILGMVFDFTSQLGKALIASGIASEAFKKLLPAGPLAIAAGIALVALSGVAKSQLSKGPAGGGSSSGGGTGSVDLSTVKVPAAANGGLAYAPSMVQVGDNPRARFDPEVIKPASHLEKLLNIPRNTESSMQFSVPQRVQLVASGTDLQATINFENKRIGNLR